MNYSGCCYCENVLVMTKLIGIPIFASILSVTTSFSSSGRSTSQVLECPKICSITQVYANRLLSCIFFPSTTNHLRGKIEPGYSLINYANHTQGNKQYQCRLLQDIERWWCTPPPPKVPPKVRFRNSDLSFRV